MAYIIKSQVGAAAEPVSLLAKSGDFYRQRDTYILASRFRNRDCMRLWNDFAAEQPAMARLIIKDVENDRRESAVASGRVDDRLREAERLVTKTRKPKVAKSGRVKVSKRRLDAIGEAAARETALAPYLNSGDPWQREMARAALESRGR